MNKRLKSISAAVKVFKKVEVKSAAPSKKSSANFEFFFVIWNFQIGYEYADHHTCFMDTIVSAINIFVQCLSVTKHLQI